MTGYDPRMRWALVACSLASAGCGRIGFELPHGDATTDVRDLDATESAVTFLQATTLTSNSSGNSASSTLSSAPPMGSLIVVYAWSYGGPTKLPPGGVVDDGGNVYTRAVTLDTSACSVRTGSVAIYYATALAPVASSLTITATATGAIDQEVAMVAAVFGGFGSTPHVQVASRTTPAGVSPQSIDVGPLTTGPHALVASAVNGCSGSPLAVSWADNRGFTARGMETDSNSHAPGYAADQIVAAGTHDAAWTLTYTTPSNQVAIAVLAAFE